MPRSGIAANNTLSIVIVVNFSKMNVLYFFTLLPAAIHWRYSCSISLSIFDSTRLFFLTIQRSFTFFTLMPLINREWVPTSQAPFPWFSQSVLLWVGQAGTSGEPRYLSLWLPSFAAHFLSHVFRKLSQFLECLICSTCTLIILARISPLTCLFTTLPTACWVMLQTLPVLPWEHLWNVHFSTVPIPSISMSSFL